MSVASPKPMTSLTSVLESLNKTPYGQDPADPKPGFAQNRSAADEYIKCYVRNWSGNIERKYVFEAISAWRGGKISKELASKKAQDFDIELHRAEARAGNDANVYHTSIKPVKALLKFDGLQFEVLPSTDPKKDPEWTPIPSGVLDLYYGNIDRLESTDARERSKEWEAVLLRRRDICVRRDKASMETDPRKPGGNVNEFGYLEFKREFIEPKQIAIDAAQVFSDDYIEV